MSSSPHFIIDQLGHWVWALAQPWPSNPNGYDVSYMVPDMDMYQQADAHTLGAILMQEIRLDVDHQQFYWLQVDGAMEAIAMLESDGLLDANAQKLEKNWYTTQMELRQNKLYTARIKPNVERIKKHFREIPAMWSAVAEDPNEMSEAIRGFNEYNRKITQHNKWDTIRDQIIHDGVAYGSGCINVIHDASLQLPGDSWFEERALQGQPLEYDEYRRFHKLTRSHIIEYVPTFELVRHRHATGAKSAQLNDAVHPMITRIRQIRVADARRQYPEHARQILAGASNEYERVNPLSMHTGHRHDTITEYTVQIRMPVSYTLPMQVHMGNGNYKQINQHRQRHAIVEVKMLHDVGIVDMCIDKYHHNTFTFEQWVHTTSSKHACGIGSAKYGRDMERTFNVMLNGSLRYFRRMSKGGGFFYTGALDEATIEKRTDEGSYIGIDPKNLPQELRNRPVSDLISDNRPPNLPTVYDQIMMRAEDSINRSMMVPDAARGIRQGESGRHELALKEQAEQAMGSGTRAFLNFHQPVGERLHSNIVQFDGKEELEVKIQDAAGGQPETIVLNRPEGLVEEYDPIEDEYFVFPLAVRNNLLTLRYTTQLASSSIIPDNPTERMLFYQDYMSRMIPFLEMGAKGYVVLRNMDKYAYGKVPGMQEFIEELIEMDQAQMEQEAEVATAEAQREAAKEEMEQRNKAAELQQNNMRLKQHHVQKILDTMAKNGLLKGQPNVEQLTEQLQSKN